MPINITNQKPGEIFRPDNILPKIDISIDEADFEVALNDAILKDFVEPIFQPLNPNQDVKMTDNTDPNNPQDITKDALTNGLIWAWGTDVVDPDLDTQLSDIYYQSLLHTQPNNWLVEQQPSIEAMSKLRLPLPSSSNGRIIKYTPKTDVIPFAKKLLANSNDPMSKTEWFAYMSGFLHDYSVNDYLLLTVQSERAWDTIKTTVSNMRQMLNQSGYISTDTNNMLASFDNISLNGTLSAGLFLPKQNCNEAYSFTRIIMNTFAITEQSSPELLSVQPINMRNVYMPSNIIILNLEQYAHASDSDIIKDWDDIQKAFTVQKRLNIVSTKKLMSVKSVNAMTQPSQGQVRKSNDPITRRAQKPFSKKPITAKGQLDLMKKIIQRTTTQRKTENTYIKTKQSFMRPNRRRPDDVNAMGKLKTTKYRPDIHIYIDTSGSISEDQYRDAVGSLIKLTQQINADLYITSFSHVISQTVLLKTKGLSPKQVYKDFLKIPKVSGGTNFENVWHKIDQLGIANDKRGKSYQLNFIITDFGYNLQRDRRFSREQHSHKYTYYVPISIDPSGWKHIIRYASQFSKQMAKAGAVGIRKHLLM